MIVNFYVLVYSAYYDLLVSKNLQYVPAKGTILKYENESYYIDKIEYDINMCEYKVYLVKLKK